MKEVNPNLFVGLFNKISDALPFIKERNSTPEKVRVITNRTRKSDGGHDAAKNTVKLIREHFKIPILIFTYNTKAVMTLHKPSEHTYVTDKPQLVINFVYFNEDFSNYINT